MNGNNESGIISKSNSNKVRFNFIDVLLIIIALLVVVTIIYVLLPTSWINNLLADDTVSIEYTIEIQGVDEALLKNIKDQFLFSQLK